MQNFPSQSGVQTLKIIYRPIYKFRLKKAIQEAFLAHQMQNFLRQADVQTPKIIIHTNVYEAEQSENKRIYLCIRNT